MVEAMLVIAKGSKVCYKQAHVWCPCTPANKTQLTLNYTYLYEMTEIHHMMGTNQMMVIHHKIKMMYRYVKINS